MDEVTLVTREDGGQNVVVDGEVAVQCARGWEVSHPTLTFEKAGRQYINALLSYSVDGGYGPEERTWALDELSSKEASNAEIAQAARDFAAKKIGFAEFKRTIRESSLPVCHNSGFSCYFNGGRCNPSGLDESWNGLCAYQQNS